MIIYPKFPGTIKKIYAYHQEHVFSYWKELSDCEKRTFLEELSKIDFKLLNNLIKKEVNTTSNNDYKPVDYIQYIDYKRAEAEKIGLDYLKKSKTAAFVVAGGQASRLGYNGPKGSFKIGPCSRKSLFQIFSEKIHYWQNKLDIVIPFFIMTSKYNYNETCKFFKEKNYFNLKKENIYFFTQSLIPSIDINGKLILAEKNKIFQNPDGHGGSLSALKNSGMLKIMKEKNIETISYFQVDNPLIKIIDPIFIGYHIMNNAQISNKTLLKYDPEEKIGVFVKDKSNKTRVVEYIDLTDKKKNQKDKTGKLNFKCGNIAIHLFERDFLEEMTSQSSFDMQYHVSKKRIKAYTNSGFKETDGLKFEKFVFDALMFAKKTIIMETKREDEFAPVKNATGYDSVESAQKLLSNLSFKWLKEKNIQIPKRVKKIEISPLKAYSALDLEDSLLIPDIENVYIE